MEQKPATGPGSNNAEEISLEGIDKILDEVDPGFSEDLKSISADDELKKAEIEPSLVDESGLLTEDEKEEKIRAFIARHPILFRLLTPFRWFKAFFLSRLQFWRNQFRLFLQNLILFFRVGLPERIKYILGQISAVKKAIGQKMDQFKALPRKQRLSLWACALMGLASVGIIYFNLKTQWLPSLVERPQTDISKHGQEIKTIGSDKDLVSFYQSFPQVEHTVLLGKFVVNLKRTTPTENPMGAFELYVGADSQSTAIEVKDREKELLDRVSRAVEELTYNEVSGNLGKARLKALVRQEINEALNQGRVEKVYFKTIIIKP